MVIETPGHTLTERFAPFDSYQAEVENLSDAIQSIAPPLVDGNEALQNMRVLDAVRVSAHTGKWETL